MTAYYDWPMLDYAKVRVSCIGYADMTIFFLMRYTTP